LGRLKIYNNMLSRSFLCQASTVFRIGSGKDIFTDRGSLVTIGQAQEGLTLLSKGVSTLRATGAVTIAAYGLTMLAEAHADLRQHIERLNCLTEAAQMVRNAERYSETEERRLRSDWLKRSASLDVAEQALYQSLSVAKRQNAKLLELPAVISVARLWRDQGNRREARELLAPIYGWFTSGFDTAVLQDATSLLEQLQ
jgi:hypothetical protein